MFKIKHRQASGFELVQVNLWKGLLTYSFTSGSTTGDKNKVGYIVARENKY